MYPTEKRDYFRLDAQAGIEWLAVTEAQTLENTPDACLQVPGGFTLVADLMLLDIQGADLLRQIRERDPDVGAFLSNLNQRLEVVSRHLVEDGASPAPQSCQVSQAGMSFGIDQLLPVGQFLALKIVIHPGQLGLTTWARVTNCRLDNSGEGYNVGVRFVRMPDALSDVIGRYILRRQAELRRSAAGREI